MNKLTNDAGTGAEPQVRSSEWLAIPFKELFREAVTVQERIRLLQMAKEYHIRAQNFEEAYRCRTAEKALRDEAALAAASAQNIGADLMANSDYPTGKR